MVLWKMSFVHTLRLNGTTHKHSSGDVLGLEKKKVVGGCAGWEYNFALLICTCGAKSLN